MYIDKFLEIADNVSIAATAGSAVIGVGVPHDYAGFEPNSGRNLFVVITLSAAIVSAGDATVQFRVVSDAATPVHVSTSTQHAETGVIAYTALNTAKRIIIPLPEGPNAYEGYIGLVCVTAGATTTAGSINAFITMDAERWRAFPEFEA
jgi:hypothetical protein